MKNFLIGVLVVIIIILGYLQFKSKEQLPTSSEPYLYKSSIATKLPEYIGGQKWPPQITSSTKPYSCKTGVISEAEKTEEKTINGKIYCIQSIADGAAGSIYHDYTITTKVGNGTRSASFILRYHSCGVYGGETDEKYQACMQNQSDVTADLYYYIDSLIGVK